MAGGDGQAGKKSGGKEGLIEFFAALFQGFSGGNDLDREKRRRLKTLRKALRKSGRFFKVNGNLVQPGLAQWFYEIYRVAGPLAVLLDKYGDSDVLKSVIISHYLPEHLKNTAEGLKPDQIKQRSAQLPGIKVLVAQVSGELKQLRGALDGGTVRQINKTYSNLQTLRQFAGFDYYYLLRKFDSKMPEGDFLYRPHFEAVEGASVRESIMDFLEVFYGLDGQADWNLLFEILKNYRDLDVVSRKAWNKIMAARRDMLKTATLDLIVRYLLGDPSWSPRLKKEKHEIVSDYYNGVKSGAENAVNEIIREQKNRKSGLLAAKLFGTAQVNRTQNYTERDNATFHKKNLSGYTFVEPINFLKAYFLDFYKSRVRTLADLFIIQGQWSVDEHSREFSDIYHQLLALSDELLALDERLSDDGPEGKKVMQLLRQSVRDRSALINLKIILQNVNNNARNIIVSSAELLDQLKGIIQQLMEEYQSGRADLVVNWKEIESWAETPLQKQMSDAAARMALMVQLLRLSLK